MVSKIIKKILRLISLELAVCITVFVLITLSPIDPVQSYVGAGVAVSPEQRENIAEYWGLNSSLEDRFLSWGKSILKGDFGTSLIYRQPVISVIYEKFASSIALMGTAWILSSLIGYSLGIIMGVNQDKPLDRIIKSICILLSSTPTFWVGLLVLIVFSVNSGWFPIGLSVPSGILSSEVRLIDKIYHMILPALTLSLTSFAAVALHTREKVITVLESDYVLFAKARGESQMEIIQGHLIRNTIIPTITMQFASFSELFGGSVLVEQVFSYPGLGQAAVQAGLRSDIPLLLGIAIFSALFVFLGNFIADLVYGLVDPKIKEI